LGGIKQEQVTGEEARRQKKIAEVANLHMVTSRLPVSDGRDLEFSKLNI
jgi:hypothetical protein